MLFSHFSKNALLEYTSYIYFVVEPDQMSASVKSTSDKTILVKWERTLYEVHPGQDTQHVPNYKTSCAGTRQPNPHFWGSTPNSEIGGLINSTMCKYLICQAQFQKRNQIPSYHRPVCNAGLDVHSPDCVRCAGSFRTYMRPVWLWAARARGVPPCMEYCNCALHCLKPSGSTHPRLFILRYTMVGWSHNTFISIVLDEQCV